MHDQDGDPQPPTEPEARLQDGAGVGPTGDADTEADAQLVTEPEAGVRADPGGLPATEVDPKDTAQLATEREAGVGSGTDRVLEVGVRDPGASAAASPQADPPFIGRYRVIGVLGQGGFGRVYRAHDAELDRDVAIKVPVAGRAGHYLDVGTYLREARILARLSHPNIVPVYDVGHTADGRCYVVSKYMEGGDLAAKLGRGRPAFAESVGLVAALCEALHYTHTHDLFHRDIKPANILLDADGIPYLADFGLALKDEDLGKGAGCVGTAAYMSPEQARGEGHRVDGRSDIFSMGIVLYELLTGRRPFRGSTHQEVFQQIIHAEPRPPRQIDDTIPRDLDRICLKALSKRACERYATARDLAEDLQHFLEATSWAAPTEELTVAPGDVPAGFTRTLVSARSDPSGRPITIVPKGLGSFDEQDADFFLELLPGPRDRDGLPDGLRFWKTRIEATDPDRTFRVGLIYGPSGCGKSSMVKAGLLPRLAIHVCAIYVEATGDAMETRLLRGIRRRFPELPDDAGLAGALMMLRRSQGLPPGRKVLVVIDQFEQWLFARGGPDRTELVAALRQCDGEHVQALGLVRDDFWMAATRFLRDLEIDLVPDRNVAAVDLFDPRHARKVLAACGRAYEALPPGGELTKDQDAFLSQAVAGLAQDGLIVPVRLALFAEMVKGKPWTPATLRAVGGMDGVGVKFLEETFSSARANPSHRYHQKAAQAVLKALLPETKTDIKGRMRSIEELREVSGYGAAPDDFADLIRMLDTELRLITPVDPAGSIDEGTPAPTVGGHSYQLTHDYLVHSLRDWLTRKQRETRRGRAELLLEERTALWIAKPEDRRLPSLPEWARIRLLTKPKEWTEPRRRMMKRAGRMHGLRMLGLTALVVGVAFAGVTIRRASIASALVPRLLAAEIAQVPQSIEAMRDYRDWTDPELRKLLEQSPVDPGRELRARLALLPDDPGQVEYLFGRLIEASPAELPVLRDALEPHGAGLIPRLWALLEAPATRGEHVVTSAGALARFDPESPKWTTAGGKVARVMVGVSNVSLGDWVNALRPVREQLKAPLAAIFRDANRSEGERSNAADILAEYASDDPGMLAGLVMDAAPRDFARLFPVARPHAAQTVPAWQSELAKVPEPGGREQGSESAKDQAAERRARAAVALLRLGEAQSVWPHLRHSPDPRLRSFIINWLRPLGADPRDVAAELDRLHRPRRGAPASGPESLDAILFDPEVSERRAVILAMGTYDPEAFATEEREARMARLLDLYETDPDAGIHGAAEWTLRRWGQADRIAQKDAALRGADRGGRRWFVNSQGQTFVVVRGHFEFPMGSPPDEPGRRPQELQHRRVLHRCFALANKEVTVEQYQKFLDSRRPVGAHAGAAQRADAAGPQDMITWYEAAEYCNWLSRQEGLTEVYEPNDEGKFAAGMKIKVNALELDGYRLPTESEWEYMCRAGTRTSRYYGNSPQILGNYAWTNANSGDRARPCGSLFPNDLGLFDMLGNTYEWCLGRADDYEPDASNTLVDELRKTEAIPGDKSRVIRGGAFFDRPEDSRSAYRDREGPGNRYPTYGFRPARTIPGSATTSPAPRSPRPEVSRARGPGSPSGGMPGSSGGGTRTGRA